MLRQLSSFRQLTAGWPVQDFETRDACTVRAARDLPDVPVPAICILDFDGDLTDWLVLLRKAIPFEPWACFHTKMYLLETDGTCCGIIPRTIGGPYAVLIAGQFCVSGARLILGLTSAGRISPSLPLPSFVVVTSAVRDEGTSFKHDRREECRFAASSKRWSDRRRIVPRRPRPFGKS